ncbi:MAG: hypothetical protein EA428_00210 [Spirochaetaceae bacterium]|nr:MAG: hypothetical protein EA428_00210 [Spirochaetaceae bacterium]
MKRLLILVLLMSTVVLPSFASSPGSGADSPQTRSAQLTASESYNQGVNTAAYQHSSTGWGIGGFTGGLLFSWLGTGGAVLLAATSTPTPGYTPEEVEPMSYRRGYQDEARRKNIRSAAIPGVVMSTLWTLLVIAAASS